MAAMGGSSIANPQNNDPPISSNANLSCPEERTRLNDLFGNCNCDIMNMLFAATRSDELSIIQGLEFQKLGGIFGCWRGAIMKVVELFDEYHLC